MRLSQKLRMCFCIGCAFLNSLPSAEAYSADTLHSTLPEMEARFLNKNLQIIAAHYGVQADSALIRQARLWDNPTLTVDQNVYVDNHFFRHGTDASGNPTGQVYVQLQQLIQLGGKRHKAIAMATTNAGISQLQFEQLMLSLRQTLRKDFYTILQLERFNKLYQQEISELQKLNKGMEAELQAGNIARKDLLRVQAVLVSLEQEAVENAKTLEDVQAEVRSLLQLDDSQYFQPEGEKLSAIPKMPNETIDELLELAEQHNPEYKMAQLQLQYQKLNYRYQKSLVVPDLNVGPNYDRASNFAPNYFGLTLGIPLPIFNRNQGNIHAADYQVKQQQSLADAAALSLKNNVSSAYKKLALSLSVVGPTTTTFYNDYWHLFENVVESYRNRQISLVEFIDYLNGYEDIRQKQLQQQLSLQIAKEELNYQIGIDVL